MNKISYMGDGQTTNFNFNFPYFDTTNIIVTKNNQETSGFSIIGTKSGENADMPYIGGAVIFESAPSTTDSITIARKLSLERTIDYQPTALIDPTTLNQDMNYTIEVLKDFQNDLENIKTLNGDPDKIQEMLLKLDTVSQQISAMGDITQVRNNISTLDTRTNGIMDYVIETQAPTAENNYTWYRKYKSGWVEQGGHAVASLNGEKVLNLPVTMSNKRYHFIASFSLNDSDSSPQTVLSIRRQRNSTKDTTSTVAVLATYAISGVNGYTGWDFDWEVKGFAA